MSECPTTQGAPLNLPTAADSYPVGAALATLTQKIPNARIVAEDGQVLNMADLLACICEQTTATVNALQDAGNTGAVWLGAQTLTAQGPVTLTAPKGATEAVIKNDATTAAEISQDGVNWSTISAGQAVTVSASIGLVKLRALAPATAMDVTINYYGVA